MDFATITQVNQLISGVPHRADFYPFIRIESGESIQIVDFAPIKVVGRQLLFIRYLLDETTESF